MTTPARYRHLEPAIAALVADEDDAIAVMASIACELYHGLRVCSWVGFYRVVAPGVLKVGPYQGGHGCTTIVFSRGVCGRCATLRSTQIVPDVSAVPWHIACSSRTRSEIVVPVFGPRRRLIAVLDLDSELIGAFDEVDRLHLERIVAVFAGLTSSRRDPLRRSRRS
jgi:L-methionine (R)-S-oxide reductase